MKEETVLFLDRTTVESCLSEVDPIACVEGALRAHADGQVLLPAEGYMRWTNSEGAYARSLSMQGGIERPGAPLYGMKIINAAVSNPSHGLERAGGVAMLFDAETARPVMIAEAGRLSSTRTAAYTALSLERLGPVSWSSVAVVGCGAIAAAHLQILLGRFEALDQVHLFDLDPDRSRRLRDLVVAEYPHIHVCEGSSARQVVEAAEVVITATTSSRPYIEASWFRPGSFVAHVSLDDLGPEVFVEAEGLFVDDVELVRSNPRRILGRLMDDGVVGGAGRPIDGTLSEVVTGRAPGIRPSTGVVVSNPFGMSVLDVAIAGEIYAAARGRNVGHVLRLV